MNFQNSNITYKNHSYIDFASDAGILSINTSRKEVIFTFQDLEMGEGTFKMGLSHTYSNYSHLGETNVGNNWKLNIQQYIKKYDGTTPLSGFTTNDYIYVDGSGYIHKFVKYDTNKYLDENGTGMTLFIQTEPYIESKDGSRLEFYSDGKLKNIVSKGPKKEIVKELDYLSTNELVRYYDSRKVGRYFSFKYENNLLKRISLINDTKVLERVCYEYENNNLTGVYHYINNALAKVSLFKYDNNNRLFFVTSSSNGISLKIDYEDGIKVEKGLFKIVKNNIDYLERNSYPIGIDTKNNSEVKVGFNEGLTKIGAFISNAGLSLGEEDLFDSVPFEVETKEHYHTESYIMDDKIPFNILESTSLNYYTNYTNVSSNKGISYRYYYNKKGFVTGLFETDGEKLMTLTKDSGIPLFDYTNEDVSINHTPIYSRNIGAGLTCMSSSSLVAQDLNYYKEQNNNELINFVASFWVKCSNVNSTYLKASINVTHYNTIKNEVYIDNTAKDAWQYVTIPFSLLDDDRAKSSEITNIIVKVFGDGEGTYEVSNVVISDGDKKVFKHSNVSNGPNINEFYYVRLVLNDNTSKTILLNHENYLTESDMIMNSKNMSLSDVFEFSYCNDTKRITNVKEIYFKVYENVEYTGYEEEYEYYKFYNLIDRTITSTNSCVISKHYDVYDNLMNETNTVTIDNTYYGGSNYKCVDFQGRIISQQDTYGLVTVNKYDDYGNLLSVTSYNQDNQDYKLYTRYTYDDESECGKYSEFLTSTNIEDSQVNIKKSEKILNGIESIQVGNNYRQNYAYDLLNRITDISIIYGYGKIVRNHYEWDQYGKLISVSDNDNYQFNFGYDIYGSINKYSIKKNENEVVIKEKEAQIGTSEFGGDLLIEKNKETSTNTMVHNDKYSRPRKVIIDNVSNIKNVHMTYEDTNGYFRESQSIGKIRVITDEFDNSNTYYTYDKKGELCKYSIKVDNEDYLEVQQISSEDTKYTIGGLKLKTEIKNNSNYIDPRPNHTSIYYDTKASDNKDEWKELTEYKFDYEYDKVLKVVSKKTGENLTTEFSYLPTNGSKYYSTQIQSIKNKYKYLNFDYNYQYDSNQNLRRIEDLKNETVALYSYDKLNRLKTELSLLTSQELAYSYLDENGKDINRITKAMWGSFIFKEYKYDHLNRLTHFYSHDKIKQRLFYDNYDLNPYKIEVDGEEYLLNFTRDNLLTQYGDITFKYNYQNNRMVKTTSSKTVKYYYDGSKLLGEDYSDGSKIRYMYDLTGIAGVRYTSTSNKTSNYEYIRDGQNNVVAIVKDKILLVEYLYDAWGNFIERITKEDEFININPIRYKSHYYDIETGLYYIDGRYYNPLTCSYLDSMDIENVFNNSNVIGGLNLNSICIDNPIDNDSYLYTIYTSSELSVDLSYDPLEGYSWWDRNWKTVLRVTLFIVVLVVSIVLACIPATSGFGIGMLQAGLGAAISGMIIGGVIGGLVSLASGNGFFKGALEGAVTGFVDGFISGAIMYCISAGISAIQSAVKAGNTTCVKPGNCFVAGTLVMTLEGMKPIEEIKLGDKVWSWCEETKEKVLNTVTTLFRNETKELVHLQIAGEEIITTKEHPFYVADYGWKIAGELSNNDKVILYDDTELQVDSISIESTDNPVKIYNFEVENAHTYYVSEKGILVHNLCAEGKALANAKEAGIEVESYMAYIDDFSDEALDYLGKVRHNSDGTTISNHVTGTKIHKGFMDKGGKIKGSSLRYDGLKNGTLYELKPYNARNIRKAINQLATYKKELIKAGEKVNKLVLVLY